MNRNAAAAGLAWGASVAQCPTRRRAIFGGNIIREKPATVKSRSDPFSYRQMHLLRAALGFSLWETAADLGFINQCQIKGKIHNVDWLERWKTVGYATSYTAVHSTHKWMHIQAANKLQIRLYGCICKNLAPFPLPSPLISTEMCRRRNTLTVINGL